ncbi:hypothetical protein GQ568_00700 [Patescibacteria group bacterium]|nr:hypothetical protein [Patescibacteria group bacterium]
MPSSKQDLKTKLIKMAENKEKSLTYFVKLLKLQKGGKLMIETAKNILEILGRLKETNKCNPEDEIIKTLEKNGTEMTISEISKKTNIEEYIVCNVLQKLENIERVGDLIVPGEDGGAILIGKYTMA